MPKNTMSRLREIKDKESKLWKPQKQGISIEIIEEFLSSNMKMAEVNLSELPKPTPKESTKTKSTKQDSFSSSFYSWKKRKKTKQKLDELRLDIILIRRENKIALKKRKTKLN